MQQAGKLSYGTKYAYSIGQLSDSIPFNLFYIYFLYFLTDVAGMNPAVGGTISLITVLWDAITDPIIGHFSDNSKSKYGRRRPFMLCAAIPLFICTILMFTVVDLGEVFNFIYYLVVGILFWTTYTAYVIPFFALGAEITKDFNERNNLRTIAGFFMYAAVWLVSAGPMAILDRVLAAGGAEKTAWLLTAFVVGGIALVAALICWNFTRGKELQDAFEGKDTSVATEKERGIFKTYVEILKVKAIRINLLFIFFSCVNFSIASATLVYLMSNNLALSAAQQALYWSINTVITFAILPICNIFANKLGKKGGLLILDFLTIAGSLFFYFSGIDHFNDLIVFTIFMQLGNVCFWTIGYSLTYDCCEVDEFISGKRREGAILGFASFAQKLGSAIGMWLSGVFLVWIHYNGETVAQSAETMHGILQLNTLVPAVFILLAMLSLVMFPINKKNYELLVAATELRKQGKEYATKGFEKLL